MFIKQSISCLKKNNFLKGSLKNTFSQLNDTSFYWAKIKILATITQFLLGGGVGKIDIF